MGDDFELSFEDQFEDHAVDSDTPSRSNSLKLKKGNTDSQRRKEKRRSKVGKTKPRMGVLWCIPNFHMGCSALFYDHVILL